MNDAKSTREKGRGLLARFAAIGASVLVLSSCVATSRSSDATSTGGKTIPAFIGDSNILLAAGALSLTFFNRNDSFPLVIVAQVGSGIRFSDCPGESEPCATHDYWRLRLDKVLSKVKPDVYVVNLGINDTSKPGSSTTPGYAEYGKKIDYFLALLDNRPVLWTNLPCKIEPKSRLTGCNAVNAALVAAASRHRNLTVLDWASVAEPHPTWMAKAVGGVHYTTAGYAAWSGLVAKSLESRFGQ
jgi:lysophospholipase L1-like esterase